MFQDALSHDEDSCVDKRFFLCVVVWGVKVTPKNYFDIQKTNCGGFFFYILSREHLQELLRCYVKENRLICGFCEQCYTCKRLKEMRIRLDDGYSFKKQQDGCPDHPYCWKIYLFSFKDTINFRVEIYVTKKENE